MIIANGKGRVSTLAVDDDLDMNGRNVTNADVVSVNEHVTLVGARLPGKGFRHVERDGWYVSKDNNDIERKFWKDDFSVDSSSQYTGDVGLFTWDTANRQLKYTGIQNSKGIITKEVFTDGKIDFTFAFPTAYTSGNLWLKFEIASANPSTRPMGGLVLYLLRSAAGNLQAAIHDYIAGKAVSNYATMAMGIGENVHVTIIKNANQFEVYLNGLLKISITYSNYVPSGVGFRIYSDEGYTGDREVIIKDFTIAPSISYADDFATDTTERYQAVTGTVAYDDTNKRMNVTTATGANGKASGRLKSYKFCEGAQQFDVTLPTGADGDFICMVTHATDPAMTNGIGVGLQSDGAGNWNLATLSGTTVTVGASSGLTDGKTARIEIEKDITGAYWYYIYDAAGTKPTTATGKLFTTKSEGYTGWYANGAGATTQTYAIDNISIRAESIVGRTNIEVTEPFWFRDEFGENSLGRYRILNRASFSIGSGYLSFSGWGQLLTTSKLKDTTTSFKWTGALSGTANCLLYYLMSMDKYPTGSGSPESDATQGERLQFRFNAVSGTITVSHMDGTTDISTQSISGVVFTLGVQSSIQIAKSGNEITLTVDGTVYNVTMPTTISNGYGYEGFGISGDHGTHQIDDWQVSGTRVYQKPIHRGSMLESYWDGTQEVVGTTFIDDCQWDRSGERLGNTISTDTVRGAMRVDSDNRMTYFNTSKHGAGLYYVKFKCDVGYFFSPWIMSDVVTSSRDAWSQHFKHVTFCCDNGYLVLRQYAGDGTSSPNGTATYVNIAGKTVELYILVASTKIEAIVYADGVYITTLTINSPVLTEGYIGFGSASASGYMDIMHFQFIAASPDATNGIAACIPPIGGGARYGVEEEVYFDIDNEVRYNESVVLATVKTLNPANEGVEMFFGNTTDSSKITTDGTDVEAISLEDTNYKDVVKDIVLNYDDRGDEIKVGVRKTGDNVATVYVETLAVVPKVEVV